MFNFDLSGKENFAMIKSDKTKNIFFIETYDNIEYSVRVGTLSLSKKLEDFKLNNDENINNKLKEIAIRNNLE